MNDAMNSIASVIDGMKHGTDGEKSAFTRMVERVMSEPLVEQHKCEHCEGSGVVAYRFTRGNAELKRVLVPCPACNNYTEQESNELAHQLFQQATFTDAQIPDEYHGVSWDDFQYDNPLMEGKKGAIAAAYELTTRYPNAVPLSAIYKRLGVRFSRPEEYRNGLCLMGEYGVGKSRLAALIAQQIIKNRKGAALVAYTKLSSIVDEMRQAESYSSEIETQDVLNRLLLPHLLVIDEFNAVDSSQRAQKWYEQIVSARHERKLPTVYITNLPTVDALESGLWVRYVNDYGKEAQRAVAHGFGAYVASRIRQSCHCVKMAGAVMRQESEDIDLG